MNGDDLSERDKRDLTVSLRVYFERLLEEHERAHTQLAENVRVALASQDRRLDGMNEFRKSLEDFQARSISRDLFDQRTQNVNDRLGALERIVVGRDTFDNAMDAQDRQIDALNNFRSKAAGAAVVLTIVAGAVGAAIVRAFGG